MTVRVSADIHFHESDVSHNYHPGDDKCHAYGVLKFGPSTHDANIFFGTPEQIDRMIAELVALKQEMAPPVAEESSWCPGTTFMEHEEVTLYCDREYGHHGSHHAPGPDEGSEVAWSDEPVAVSA